MSEYRLRIANVVLSLLFETERESRALSRYFRRASVQADPDIQLRIRYRNDAGPKTEVPNSFFLTKKNDGNNFSAGGGLIEGRFSPENGEGDLVVQKLLTKGGYARIYEQIFYQAYFSAARRKNIDSYLLHSSGAIRNGRGYAFTGKSGTGKSTVAAFSRKKAFVVNDEITAIDLSSSPAMLLDTPFNGYFTDKGEGRAPLVGIMLLKQAPAHALYPVSDAEHIKILAGEVIPPMGLEIPFSPRVYMDMLDRAERTSRAVSLYRMEFLPDPGFWERIDWLNGDEHE